MIYEELEADAPLSQGDIIDACPLLFWEVSENDPAPQSVTRPVRVVVMTQACDLAQSKARRVLVAAVHDAKQLVDRGILKAKVIREQIRTHRVYGWYFLPSGSAIQESIVDFRDLHTVPRILLEQLVQQGKRFTRKSTPFREHLAQHFSTTYSRIALPEPYETDPNEIT